MSLVVVNDDCGEGQWSSLKSCVLVYIAVVIVGGDWLSVRIKGSQGSK